MLNKADAYKPVGKTNHSRNEHDRRTKMGRILLLLCAFLPYKTMSSFRTKGRIIIISVAPESSECLVHSTGGDFWIAVNEGHGDLCWKKRLLNAFLQEDGFSRAVQVMEGWDKTGLGGQAWGLVWKWDWECQFGKTYKGEKGQRLWRQNV